MSSYLKLPTIKWLYKVTTFFGLTPSYNFEDERELNFTKLYTISVIINYTIIPIISLKERFNSTYPFTPNITDILLDCGMYLTLTISNLINLIHIRLIHSEKLIKFLKSFQELDHVLKAESSTTFKYYAEILTYSAILLLGLLYNEVLWDIAFGFSSNWAYFFQNFQKVQLFLTAMLVYNLSEAFKCRFKYLNEILEKLELKLYVKKDVFVLLDDNIAGEIEVINRSHKKLLLMHKDFNVIFGVPVIFLCINFIFGVLHPINSAILQMLKGNVLNGLDIPNFTMHYVVVVSILALNTMVIAIPLATSCNGVMQEAKRTIELGRIMLHEIPIFEYNQLSNKLFDELDGLANELPIKYPLLTANGFYVVDHTMLFILFGSVTSYLIVLIQLNISF